eukprot:m.76190 g.76190  ORF g.76190 m.76190 type:complete len:176 (+) comp35972_c0_seq4:213-740(+)
MSRKSRADFGNIHYISSVIEKLPSPDCRRAHRQAKLGYTFSESPLRQHAKDILEIRELARDPVYQFKASSLPEDPFGGSPYCYLDNPELCSFRQAAELKDWLLGRAALEGATEVCQYLLDHGASLSTRTGGLAVIHMAAIDGCAGVLDVLTLELGDDDRHAPLSFLAQLTAFCGC